MWVVGGGRILRSARLGGRVLETYTNGSGAFDISDVPVDRTVLVRAAMGLTEATPFAVEPGDAASGLSLALGQTGVLMGRVLDLASGAPLPRASVALVPVAPWGGRSVLRAHTAEDGTYRVERILPGSYTVQAALRNYLQHHPQPLDVGPATGESAGGTRMDLRLDPGLVLSGSVQSATRRSLSGVFVSARQLRDGKPAGGRFSMRTDANGAFRLTGLMTGETYQFTAWHREHKLYVEDDVTRPQTNMRVVLEPKRTGTGTR